MTAEILKNIKPSDASLKRCMVLLEVKEKPFWRFWFSQSC